jgi:hypothetical protein
MFMGGHHARDGWAAASLDLAVNRALQSACSESRKQEWKVATASAMPVPCQSSACNNSCMTTSCFFFGVWVFEGLGWRVAQAQTVQSELILPLLQGCNWHAQACTSHC